MSELHKCIRVQVGCQSGHNSFDESLVYFEFKDMPSNHSAFRVMHYLTKWLDESVGVYYVQSFQCNQMMAKVGSKEARLKIKLAFDKAEDPPTYYDYGSNDWPPDA